MFGLMHMISSVLWLENIQGFCSFCFLNKKQLQQKERRLIVRESLLWKIHWRPDFHVPGCVESSEEVGASKVESWLIPCCRGGRGISGEPAQGVDTPVAQKSKNKEDDAWALVVWNLQISDQRIFGGLEYPESAPGASSYNKH